MHAIFVLVDERIELIANRFSVASNRLVYLIFNLSFVRIFIHFWFVDSNQLIGRVLHLIGISFR